MSLPVLRKNDDIALTDPLSERSSNFAGPRLNQGDRKIPSIEPQDKPLARECTYNGEERQPADEFSTIVVSRCAELQANLLCEYSFYVLSRESQLRQSVATLTQQNMELIQLMHALPADSVAATQTAPGPNRQASENDGVVEPKNATLSFIELADIAISEALPEGTTSASALATHLQVLHEQIKRVSVQMGVKLSASLVKPTTLPVHGAELRDEVLSEPRSPERRAAAERTEKLIRNLRPLEKSPTSSGFSGLGSFSESEDCLEGYAHEYSLRRTWLEIPVQADLSIDDSEEDNHVFENEYETELMEGGPASQWALHPSSRLRLAWDIASVLLLAYDLVMIPVSFAFQLEESITQQMITWLVVVFWTLDVVMSICTGYYTKEGKLVMSGSLILVDYLRTWFPLDFVIVSLDWTIITLENSGMTESGNMRTGRLLRGMRILRVFRLLRLTKLQKLARMIQDRIDSEYVTILVNVIKQLVFILATCHLVACAWCRIGLDTSSSELSYGESTWIEVTGMEGTTVTYTYFTALHWSLTQFTPASMSVNPHNVRERLFAVIVLVYAMVIFSSFVSSITSAMTNLRNMAARQSSQFWLLRKYFRQHSISPELSTRVFRYVSMTLTTQHSQVQQKDVELISMLSKPLQIGLQTELFSPQLVVHPFFENMSRRSRPIIRKLCCTAVEGRALSRADVLFTMGEAAHHMYFLSRGGLLYSMLKKQKKNTRLERGQWCCEAVLWVDWVHRGSMCALFESELLALNESQFQKVVMEHPTELTYPRRYGQAFVDLLNQCGPLSDVLPIEDVSNW